MNSKTLDKQVSVLFLLMSTLFCVCLITANLLETKQIALGSITITGGLLVFPLSHILNDCVCEVWGFRKVKLMIWLGFAMNFVSVMFGYLVDILPPAPYWQHQEAFHAIFGLAPRITIASFIAFLAGSFMNAYVMCWLKDREYRNFSFRAIVSTLFGEIVDSLIFFPIAFLGVIAVKDMVWLMLSQMVFKTLYEVLAMPLTISVVKRIKRYETSGT